jgi:hypothetical protein
MMPEPIASQITSSYEECIETQQPVAKAIRHNNADQILYFDFKKKKGERPILINMSNNQRKSVTLKLKEKQTRWDFLSPFKPPVELAIEKGYIFKIEPLNQSSPDYEYVSKLFVSTLGGPPAAGANNPAMPQPGIIIVNKGKKPAYPVGKNPMMPPPAMVLPAGGALIGAPANNGLVGAGNKKITKIEKIFNCVIYEKFINEFKRMLKKYPQKNVNDIMKHLFHGTRATDPTLIYGTEDGLDIRFSNAGAYGTGVYFANNSHYSSNYAYAVPGKQREFQMFVCLVLVGDSV